MAKIANTIKQLELAKPETSAQLPESFEQAARRVESFALMETQKAAHQKQLYYHNCVHINGVKQRAVKIFQSIIPHLKEKFDSETEQAQLTRMKQLLKLSAVAHDMVQEFIPQTQPGTPRLREIGVNEAATISKLIAYIEELNQQLLQQNPNSTAIFTESDIQVLKEAIEATVCLFDPSDGSLYQLLLYKPEQEISLVALILALADLGTLGMEGVEAYQEEGSLILLEENPDIISALWDENNQQIVVEYDTSDREQQKLYENIRQRLLKRTRFQVNFAKGRYSRFDREVERLPAAAIQALKTEIFHHLTEETIHKIETITPTKDETTLQELIKFFQLEKYIKEK